MPMQPNEIKAALVARAIRQTDIARQVGHSPAYVNDVITKKRRSPVIEKAVAAAIGKPHKQVFGEAA